MFTWIVPPELFEPLAIDGKETSSMGRRVIRLRMLASSPLFFWRDIALLVEHPPFEESSGVAVPGIHWID